MCRPTNVHGSSWGAHDLFQEEQVAAADAHSRLEAALHCIERGGPTAGNTKCCTASNARPTVLDYHFAFTHSEWLSWRASCACAGSIGVHFHPGAPVATATRLKLHQENVFFAKIFCWAVCSQSRSYVLTLCDLVAAKLEALGRQHLPAWCCCALSPACDATAGAFCLQT
jgi:hypothetical protein